MSNASIAIQILPLDSTEAKTLEVVDEVIEYIQSQTDNYEVSAFETTVEGEFEDLMTIFEKVVKKAGDVHPDIFVNVKVHYKGAEGQVLTTDEKTAKYRK